MKYSIIILVIAAVFMMVACEGPESLPPEPRIEFRSINQYDTTDFYLGFPAKAVKISFYFEDGDGDLGLDPPLTPGIDPSSNLFLKLYRKTNGVFELVGPGDDLYPSEYRIPFLEAGGQNKILRGTIDVTLIYLFFDTPDSLYYEFWIRDRGGHESNTEETCTFLLGENGACTPG
jgi:hypothetical protein